LAVWGLDEAGPYQAVPQPGAHWQPLGEPARYPHEHIRGGTAKLLTLFHPATGQVRVKGVASCTNAVLHAWLEEQLVAVLAALPPPSGGPNAANRAAWEVWQEGLTMKITLLAEPPPLRLLLVLDNLAGHRSQAFVLWLFAHGIMPLYTPLSGSWLNMTESIQRILVRRALAGQHPITPEQIMQWLEATARGWNAHPTPFVWGGRRQARRRAAHCRHALGASGACTLQPLPSLSHPTQWLPSGQLTH
jgi:hypothetical protein